MRQVVLVTGASSGIGKATAKKLLDEGYIVYAAARRVEMLKELEEFGGVPLLMDVTKEIDIENAMAKIMKDYPGVDVLVNNAGYAVYGAVEDIDIEYAKKQFDVNLFGLANVTKAVLPYMREVGAGKIVNVSSMGGKIYTPLGAWYHASKHALEGWSDSLRLELKQFGINVVIIEPGIVNTEFADVMVDPLMKNSGKGAYKNLATDVSRATRRVYKPGAGTPPSAVADVIARAVKSGNPKTRYKVDKYARSLTLARKWLGDKLFDNIILNQSK